ncbi:topoisomerase DNA-binding C4 zinc finger domain-containing protein [Williamsoniiplasma lucivorax]|uniref:DNA topoisomerase type IA zn finger domain-containing protein n=1 Tax=Williamsoniiplasma lucivorax TaxID=209274 RepID=A0A2S5RF40_9MOLU|nr:topoisomerase DNA-binding C4 zinc finger domain-containing protein [Williamsoniiplasma lucivorax]PPE05933.1 hypothetical protein ELUCI_v1c02240 [Williamsoniiplasma lucivorax]
MKCTNDEGVLKLKHGSYGYFIGCTNFPKCKTTINSKEFIKNILSKEGVNIYCWKRECWKCKETTPVYAYLINYQLSKYIKEFEQFGDLFGPDHSSEDEITTWMLANIPSIKKMYSKTVGAKYPANTCVNCGVLQGAFMIFSEPDSLFCILGDHLEDMVWKNISYNEIFK